MKATDHFFFSCKQYFIYIHKNRISIINDLMLWFWLAIIYEWAKITHCKQLCTLWNPVIFYFTLNSVNTPNNTVAWACTRLDKIPYNLVLWFQWSEDQCWLQRIIKQHVTVTTLYFSNSQYNCNKVVTCVTKVQLSPRWLDKKNKTKW